MRKQYIFIISAMLATALLTVLALRLSTSEDTWVCSEGQWMKHGNPTAPVPADACLKSRYAEGEVVSWETAKQLVTDCRAGKVMQTHARQVFVTVKTGGRVVAMEPEIDEIMTVAATAKAHCGNIEIATE